MEKSKVKAHIRWSIFIPMSVILLIAIITGVVAPEQFYNAQNKIVQFAFEDFGWLFQISGNLFLFICIFFMFSKYGDIKFGGPDAKPTLKYWDWFAITLCAGIATGICFWGIAEPITHFMNPPKELGLKPGSEAAANFAMTTSFIHWTFIPYAMYAIAGLGIAFCVHNMKLPYQISSLLYPIFGKKVYGTIGAVVDNICMFAMVGAVAAVLGVGAMQMGSGLNVLTGIQTGKTLWVILLALLVVAYIFCSWTGLTKGIRWLSDKNSKIYLFLMIFILVVGPTTFILKMGTQGVGDFIQNYFTRTHYLSPIEGSEWPRWWPIYYWAIWLAYAPMEGMFFASLCKGRTIREFIIVNLICPAVFGIVWFAVFGGAAINVQLTGGGLWEAIQKGGLEASVFAFLSHYPLSKVISWIFVITIFISIVTLCDSMTSTVASLTSTAYNDENQEAPGVLKIYWGIVMASMAIINILCTGGGKISGIDATKQISTVAGFPILFFMLIMAYCTVKIIVKGEKYDVVYHPETAQVEEIVLGSKSNGETL
ncbi:choline/carnitine/betaine transport [Clostridium pascui]|uniref:BCCT family transporter n=1 Tax=Clostridium pascui TaxID=46609 RepID=UPI001958AEEB|nr:BCCT family transporter [Clostridium pascui]MBM7871836.1 choline/carnitine/betaine transport [Clostridium pascui]